MGFNIRKIFYLVFFVLCVFVDGKIIKNIFIKEWYVLVLFGVLVVVFFFVKIVIVFEFCLI